MLLRVTAGSVTFNGLTGDGFVIAPDGFVGWDDSTATKRQVVALEQAHGDFSIPGFRASRIVTISGTCLASSEQSLANYGARLSGLFADGALGSITVDHSGNRASASCYVDGQPTFTMFAGGAAATYRIQFWCPDPRKYGTSNTFGPATTVTAVHYGNFTAAPVLTVAGTMPFGYTIAGPAGKVYTVTAAVVAGSPHVIDMATGYLTIGGVIQTGVVSVANVWGIPSGNAVTMVLTPVSGTGTLTAVVKDTSI